MDAYIRSDFFSRQGKATKHLFNGFKTGEHRELSQTEAPSMQKIDPLKLLEKVTKERLEAERSRNKSTSPSSFFKSISRDFTLPTSESPGAGHYFPKYSVLDSRVNQGPKYFKPKKNKKIAKVYLPGCLNMDLKCRAAKSNPYGLMDPFLLRTVHNYEDHKLKVEEIRSLTPIPEKLKSKIIAPISFALQKPREPFVKLDSGPNEKRFDYNPSKVEMSFKFQRPQSVDFSKMSERQNYPVRSLPGPYEVNADLIMPKLVINVPDFSKQINRKPLHLEHLLNSPESPNLPKYTMAYNKQGNVKGPKKLPLMHTTTARDDSMYRVTEAYSLNSKRSGASF